MSLFLTLTREHELFSELIERLEHSLTFDDSAARQELTRTALVLLPALGRHEEIEDLVFGSPRYRRREGAAKILAQLDAQHRKIETLRKEILELLETEEGYDLEHLKDRISALCERLRVHFKAEEAHLWPHFERSMGGASERTLDLRARRQLDVLKNEIRQTRAMASDYVGNAP